MKMYLKFKKNIIRVFYSCDGLRGFLLNSEDFLNSSRISFFRSFGKYVARKNYKKCVSIIDAAQASMGIKIVSIILPVLNSEETIAIAIKSIQAQSYKHWELLIVDDGSTDATPEIIRDFAKVDSRIKLYQNSTNKGVAYARNVGLYYARGDFITFHDADDTSHPERLEYQVAGLLTTSNIELFIFQYVRVNEQGDIYIINGKRKWNRVSGMMFKKQTIDKIGYFKPLKISEDSEYYERIVATFGKASRKIICKTLYYALFSPDSLLFSNANVVINDNAVDYQIHDSEYAVLKAYRLEHKKISSGEISPYQGFSIDEKITQCIYPNE